MITKGEQDQLRLIIQDPKFRLLERLADETCQKIDGSPLNHETEWETIKSALLREGEVRGIRRLIQTYYEEAAGRNE